MNGSEQLMQMSYFAPLLPWQSKGWEDLVARSEQLPHGMLFSGMQGIGKRAFVWRFVAWMLCANRQENTQKACGHCQSCHWLTTGTHPDFRVLPEASFPLPMHPDAPSNDNLDRHLKSVKSKMPSNKKSVALSKSEDKRSTSIKVDDIRALQPFISQGSLGLKICVIDYAETMTIAAANALLKTLEEPSDGVLLFLISDAPAKLLPTIKSRVQKVAIDQIERDKVISYLAETIKSRKLLNNPRDNKQDNLPSNTQYNREEVNDIDLNIQITQLLNLANGAPLAALNMLTSNWYQHRNTWLQTWLALRSAKRSGIAASDYWQSNLSLTEFITLSEVMLMDLCRCCIGMPTLQLDLDLRSYPSVLDLDIETVQWVMSQIDDIKTATLQNVQDKVAYDKIMLVLENL